MGTTNDTEDAMQAKPQREHEWLATLAGEWESEGEAEGPDGEKFQSSGREAVRTLGDLWTLFEGSGEMPGGGQATTLMTLGFDPARGRFVGSWVGSMATYHWVYEGSLDSAGKVLTLDCEGPAMEGEGTARYQDIIEIVDQDHRLLRARVQGADGDWKRIHGHALSQAGSLRNELNQWPTRTERWSQIR